MKRNTSYIYTISSVTSIKKTLNNQVYNKSSSQIGTILRFLETNPKQTIYQQAREAWSDAVDTVGNPDGEWSVKGKGHSWKCLKKGVFYDRDHEITWANYNDVSRRVVTLNGGLIRELPQNPWKIQV